MKIQLVAPIVTVVLVISPASAATTACTSEAMAKSLASVDGMPDGPGKMAMMRELGTMNTAISKSDMRSACRSHIRVQRMGSIRS